MSHPEAEAFAALYDRHAPEVAQWLRRRADPESARELLAGRLAEPEPASEEPAPEPEPESEPERVPAPRVPKRARSRRRAPAPAKSTPEAIGDFLGSRQGQRLQREVVRGVFGMLRRRL